MKIHSAYLQNQLAFETGRVSPGKQTSSPQTVRKDTPTGKNPSKAQERHGGVRFELSKESERILSLSEKKEIERLFVRESALGRTYTPQGKVTSVDVYVGRRIDLRG
jgi:hypothetical protein